VDADFLRGQLRRAIALRRFWVMPETNALRLVHAESDGLPGLVVDRYNDWLVVQLLTAGVEYWRDTLVSLLAEITGIQQIYERSDVDVRKLEGLAPRAGSLLGGEPGGPVEVSENWLRYLVDIRGGQKTGFYLDQRHNREQVGALCAGRRVLNCFSYTGGFSVYALASGAESVLSVDSSGPALHAGEENIRLNNLPAEKAESLEGDVFKVLREFNAVGRTFDLIILDPPKFAQTAAQAQRAARGYKDINRLALQLLTPGGILATFSCSGGISPELFQKIIAGAALDAGRDAKIVLTLTQAPDHPVAMNFPEGAYLKGLVLQV
jgi:23S rRNA (cytosine1962-C5)-methyltransferase